MASEGKTEVKTGRMMYGVDDMESYLLNFDFPLLFTYQRS